MKAFFLKLIVFMLPFLSVIVIVLFLPATPRTKKSLLFAEIQKDSLLKNVASPRLIFLGGSNLSFGMNCQLIKDSLGINPINTGIHCGIGLIYMMNNTLKYIKKGDTIIISPEYEQFYDNFAWGKEELFRTVLDVNPSGFCILRLDQIFRIIEFLPKYSLSKLDPENYFNIKESDIYSVKSFNRFGDVYSHWDMHRQDFIPNDEISGKFNDVVMQEIVEFQNILENKKAVLYVTYPCYQNLSYNKSLDAISKVESEFRKNGLKILGFPGRYMIPDSMMFNTFYHLNKIGVNYRTQLFIEDFKNARRDNIKLQQ